MLSVYRFLTVSWRLRWIGILGLLFACSPASEPVAREHPATGAVVEAVDMNEPTRPAAINGPVQIGAARNEWVSFVVQLRGLARGDGNSAYVLRLQPLKMDASGQAIGTENYSAFQILPMPVEANKAGYVRHTGLPGAEREFPRALLPAPMDAGGINASALRDPSHPFDPASRAGGDVPALVWFDIHIPPQTRPGVYSATCDLMVSGQSLPVSQVQVSVQVFDFAIPDERHLLMVSQVDWRSLERLYPDRFEAITPRLINRRDAVHAPVVKVLDQLMKLAEKNRTEVVIPRLQPTVKWPAAQPPQVDWSDFDSLLQPWLSGQAFADKTPLGYWPIPTIDYLDNFDPKSQHDYWAEAATHFNQKDWLERSAVFIDKQTPGRATALECIQLSLEAARILDAHPLLRITLPLEDDQMQFASPPENSTGIDPKTTGRIMAAATGIVFAAPEAALPQGAEPPSHWLRTDIPGLVPYVGAGGSERDVRLWAWLAYLKKAGMILWNGALPRQDNPTQQADPNELVWFYPGQWFGIDEPVPSIQLKWLRRAQQDYEYLYLAGQRGMQTNALMLARLMTRQVEIQPGQTPDPVYGLLTGTVEQSTWDEAQSLLARTILLRAPGRNPDDPAVVSQERTLNLDTIRWQAPKERPFLIPRTAQWIQDDEFHVVARLGVDIYNGGDNRPEVNQLRWTSAGDGWEFRPQPVVIGTLQTYWVQRFDLEANIDLEKIDADSRKPLTISFVDGYTKSEYHSQAVLPIAASDRREGRLNIDGKLDEWQPDDLIQDGPMTRMFDRPSIQRRQIESASTTSQIYTAWADENLYVAFKLNGISKEGNPYRNYLDYQFRRAWGEDLCEILIQPILPNNTLGPITHIVCKPNGVVWVERKTDETSNAEPWAAMEGTAVRYASDPDHGPWTGEVAIPWKIILNNNGQAIPKLLRFNFAQHLASSGESATWAGPVDFGRDDSFMGLLYLRQPMVPGMRDSRPGMQ